MKYLFSLVFFLLFLGGGSLVGNAGRLLAQTSYGYDVSASLSVLNSASSEIYQSGLLSNSLQASVSEEQGIEKLYHFSLQGGAHYNRWGIGYQLQWPFLRQPAHTAYRRTGAGGSESGESDVGQYISYLDNEFTLSRRVERLGDLPVFQLFAGLRLLHIEGFEKLPLSMLKKIYFVGFQFEPQLRLFGPLEASLVFWFKTGQDFSEFSEFEDLLDFDSKLFDLGLGLKIFFDPQGFFLQVDGSYFRYGSALIEKNINSLPEFSFKPQSDAEFELDDWRLNIKVGYRFTRPHYNLKGKNDSGTTKE